MKRLCTVLLTLCLIAVIGCGDEDTPTINTNVEGTAYSFDTYRQYVDKVAPAAYTGPAATPAGQFDSMWTDGQYPLLGKVFGENEPMSLYSNVEYLDVVVTQMNVVLGNGDSTGFVVDTPWVSMIDINGPQNLPTSVVSVMGFSSVELDRALLINDPSGDTVHIGFHLTDSTQTILAYQRAPWDGGWDSFLFYGFVNTVDSTVDIKGVFYKIQADQSVASWVYDMQTVNLTDFAYRMAWYAEDFGDTTGVGSIIGGGDASDQFAMKYRQFIPADAPAADTAAALDQMFDASYNYLGAIASGYETYVDISTIFTYSDMPTAFVESPWAGR